MLSWDEEEFISKIPPDKIVTVKPYDEAIGRVAREIIDRVQKILPGLEVRHMGASALGISGQGDIDIYIFSDPTQFYKSEPLLTAEFGEPQNRRYDSILWDFEREGHPVELYLTDPDSLPMQKQIAVYEILKKSAKLREEYQTLKEDLNGATLREYQTKKYEFYHRILDK